MIVCLCKGVRHTDVEHHIDRGCHTVRAIGQACGAGTDCGGCVGDLVARLERAAVRRRAERAALAGPLAAK
ncbi:MAG: (2Fe-2S)-binding protein [Alphaproteobacteria bacterium]|nr:(2Fe-2S)-binding protein [Alphaproteobacteria bacterium]